MNASSELQGHRDPFSACNWTPHKEDDSLKWLHSSTTSALLCVSFLSWRRRGVHLERDTEVNHTSLCSPKLILSLTCDSDLSLNNTKLQGVLDPHQQLRLLFLLLYCLIMFNFSPNNSCNRCFLHKRHWGYFTADTACIFYCRYLI